MAKATKNIIAPVPVVENFTVTLELSKEEAKLVRDVMYIVGGPNITRRRFADSVLSALNAVLGVRIGVVKDIQESTPSIYFKSPEEQ